eukprot:TRINITY_DN2550_c0_g4_i1.p1 TRINITY_DN2550_c0_g4~~TRINITY_DN2550_c0_g4_i1.p1  ORF type:complete len:477 (+),score=79.72 TRINITY_DN2550_c0_g4_i1:191-1621(+)
MHRGPNGYYFNKWIVLAAGIVISAVSGTTYMFGAYQAQLKETMKYSQTQINSASTIGNVGGYCSVFMGVFYDNFGARVTLMVSSVMVFAGYILLWLGASHHFYTNNVIIGLFLALASLSNASGYTAALATSVKNFPEKHRGRVVGIIAAMYGLSAAIFTYIYKYAFSPNEIKLFFFLCVTITSIYAVFGLFLTPVPSEIVEKENLENQTLLEKSLSIQEKKVGQGRTLNPFQLFVNIEFLALLYTFLCITGPGLMVINNVGTISQSLGGDPTTENNLVIVLSIANFLGRFIFGSLSDLFSKKLSRGFFVMGASLVIASAHLYLTFATQEMLYGGVILTGLGYGGSWALIPTIISELFGEEYFGSNFGIVGLAPALGSFIFSTVLASRLYNIHLTAQEIREGVPCMGQQCFQESFMITFLIAVSGLISGYIFVRRTRSFYFGVSDRFSSPAYLPGYVEKNASQNQEKRDVKKRVAVH